MPRLVLQAAHYFDIKLVHVPHDDKFRLSLPHARKAVNSNTVAVYASAPSFPHGVIDDIEALAELCQSRGIGLHVDNCLGGFLTSFMAKQGLLDRKFDFSVPGMLCVSVPSPMAGPHTRRVVSLARVVTRLPAPKASRA